VKIHSSGMFSLLQSMIAAMEVYAFVEPKLEILNIELDEHEMDTRVYLMDFLEYFDIQTLRRSGIMHGEKMIAEGQTYLDYAKALRYVISLLPNEDDN